jgi:hypothetical protein
MLLYMTASREVQIFEKQQAGMYGLGTLKIMRHPRDETILYFP